MFFSTFKNNIINFFVLTICIIYAIISKMVTIPFNLIIKEVVMMTFKQTEFKAQISKAREEMLSDKFMPLYHYAAPMVYMNDPNGLCFFKGHWHMFYQSRAKDVFAWGHAYSKDAIHWVDMPDALTPDDNDNQCWSGGVMVEETRAIATYYGLDSGIMIAVSEDDMLEKWTKVNGGKPVIPSPITDEEKEKYLTFDPYIWKKDNKYYLISGKYRIDPISGKKERDGFLFESNDLVNWTFLHPFLAHDIMTGRDDDLACPYFVPLENKHVLFHFSHASGPKYIIGNYDQNNDKFIVTSSKSMTSSASFFGGLLAPSVFPESQNSLRLINNIHFCKATQTVNQIMSLPKTVTFSDKEKDELAFRPIDEVTSLRKEGTKIQLRDIPLQANKEFIPSDIFGNCNEFEFEFEAKMLPALELRVCRSKNAEEYTSISIYRQRGNTCYKNYKLPEYGLKKSHDSVLILDTLHSSLDCDANRRVPEFQSGYIAPEENLKIRIFVDKSVVEVFVNDRIAASARVYPTLDDSISISVTPIGGDIKMLSLVSYEMDSIYNDIII